MLLKAIFRFLVKPLINSLTLLVFLGGLIHEAKYTEIKYSNSDPTRANT